MHAENQRFSQAIALYEHAWQKGGYCEKTGVRLGALLSGMGRQEDALKYLSAVLLKNPANQEARFHAVACLCELGDHAKACETARGFSGSSTIWRLLSEARISEREYDFVAARRAYAAANLLIPGNILVMEGMGRICYAQEEFDSAAARFSHARAFDAGNMALHMLAGKTFERIGRPDSAYDCYAAIDAMCPEFPGIQVDLGRVASKNGHRESAVRIFKRGLQRHPKDGELLYLLGLEYKRSEHYAEAVKSFQAAFKTNRKPQIEALLQIGGIYRDKLCNEGKARKYFSRYIKAGGKNQAAMAYLNNEN